MKVSPALKSSLFVAILAGLFAFPFSGFGLMEYVPQDDAPISQSQTAAVLGVSNIPVKSSANIGELNIVHQEDLTLNLSDDTSQKFYNVLPEEYVSDKYEIIVIVPNDIKDLGLKASLSKSELTYDLEVEIANHELQFQQIELSILVVSK